MPRKKAENILTNTPLTPQIPIPTQTSPTIIPNIQSHTALPSQNFGTISPQNFPQINSQNFPNMPAINPQNIPNMPAMHSQNIPNMPMQGMPNYDPSHIGQYPTPMFAQMQVQMMQMMQMMQAQVGIPGMDTAAQPFHQSQISEEMDPGLDADIIRPHHLRSVVKQQEALPVQEVLDCLCLTEDGKYSLGGIPKGCTIALVGPPGKGKTRTAIASLCKVAYSDIRCAFVVAEEGFIDEKKSGRDDLCSRLTKIGMKTLNLSEAQFQKKVAKNIAVIQSQYHKGHTWDSFVTRYRFIIEKEGIQFVIIDSLNTLDPSKTKTADNLSALKTYNHEKGVTCLTIGQIKDAGTPVGGEALIHTADAVFFLEEIGLASKEIAEQWGAKYRDRITVIRCIKSVTTPIFPNPIRVISDEESGVLKIHPNQPQEYRPLPLQPTTLPNELPIPEK